MELAFKSHFFNFRDAINYIKTHDGNKKIVVKLIDRWNEYERESNCFLKSTDAINYLEKKNIEDNLKWWRQKT
jgi:hypothetical protein